MQTSSATTSQKEQGPTNYLSLATVILFMSRSNAYKFTAVTQLALQRTAVGGWGHVLSVSDNIKYTWCNFVVFEMIFHWFCENKMRQGCVYYKYTLTSSVTSSLVTRLRAGQPRFGFRQGRDGILLPLPPRPDRLWGLPTLLSSGYRGLFPRK